MKLPLALLIALPLAAQVYTPKLTITPSVTLAGATYNLYRVTGACPTAIVKPYPAPVSTGALPAGGASVSDPLANYGLYCYWATMVVNSAGADPTEVESTTLQRNHASCNTSSASATDPSNR